jgi:Tfp pilus assembly protein FimT
MPMVPVEKVRLSPTKQFGTLKIPLHRSRSSGFSLVELLLTMVLILCLAAASVFTFTAIYTSSNLDEGVDRFQSLIRFAQAEAATTGRKVRLEFVPATPLETTAETELRNIKVMWEADLLNAPGVFEEYTNKAWSEEIVNELVGVQKVKTAESPEAGSAVENTAVTGTETADAQAPEEEFPSITFYPDGSCDSADIVLASRNPEDERRLEVHLSGMLGSVSTRTLGIGEDSSSEEEEADLTSGEYGNESYESSQAAQSQSSDLAQ